MANTIIGLGDAKAVKRWASSLAVSTGRDSTFTRKFVGVGESAKTCIQLLTDLESDAGDQISYDLSMQLKGAPVEGSDFLEGQEENLKFYTDSLFIDQQRKAAGAGDKMTRKRTLHDLRRVSRSRMSEFWAKVFDEQFSMYLSGGRGINADFIFPLGYTGRANNAFTAPDADHILYAGSATSKATLTAADKMSLTFIDRLKTKSTMMGGGSDELSQIQPLKINGEEHFCLLMNPYQAHDLRTDTSTGQWLDVQKAAAAAEGRNNPIFKGSLGMYNNVVLQESKVLVRYGDYGAGGDVAAGRALFMGVQCGVIAFGSPGNGMRFDWVEESRDYKDKVYIGSNTIYAVKKSTFNSKDFGLISADTAAASPG